MTEQQISELVWECIARGGLSALGNAERFRQLAGEIWEKETEEIVALSYLAERGSLKALAENPCPEICQAARQILMAFGCVDELITRCISAVVDLNGGRTRQIVGADPASALIEPDQQEQKKGHAGGICNDMQPTVRENLIDPGQDENRARERLQDSPLKDKRHLQTSPVLVPLLVAGAVLAIFAVLVFTRTICLSHEYSGPTCTQPATCVFCGHTKGSALGHDFIPATRNTPATCTRCGETRGAPLGG